MTFALALLTMLSLFWALLFVGKSLRGGHQYERLSTCLTVAAVVTSVLFVSYVTLMSRPGARDSQLSLIPLVDTIEAMLEPITFSHALGGVLANIALFVPVGMAVAMFRIRGRLLGWRPVLGTCLVFSLLVEVTQLLMNHGAVAAVDDLITNTFGALLGWLLIRWLGQKITVKTWEKRRS